MPHSVGSSLYSFCKVIKFSSQFPVHCEYISQEEANQLLEKCTEIGRLLGGMMAKSEQFCKPFPYKISEEQADYFADSPATH
jgi:hypothetical protein